MRRPPRTRAAFVRALLETGRGGPRRIARAHRELADEGSSRLLEARFFRLVRIDRTRAETVVRAAEEVGLVSGSPVPRAIALRLRGVFDHLGGRARAALKELVAAVAIFSREGSHLDAGDVSRALVDVRMMAGDDRGSLRAAHEARRHYARGGGADPKRLGSLAMNLGNVHHRRDRHVEALRSYREAARHFAKVGEPLRLANVDYNRANILASLDRIDEARELYASAREVFRAEGLRALEAQADYALAGLDLLEGRLDACVRRLDRVRVRQVAMHDRLAVAHTDLEAAEAYLRLNRAADAEGAALEAEAFFRRAGHDAEQITSASVLGGAALQQGHPSRAARSFARARDLGKRAGNPVAVALAEIGLAQAESRAGRPEPAVASARRAAALLKRRGLASREARALAVGADAAFRAGRPRLARAWAERATSLAGRRGELRVRIAALLVLGRLDERGGSPDRAFRRFLDAERCVERLRRGITTEESRLAFALDKSEVYEALISNRLERGDRRSVRQALEFAERGKARALAERLAESRIEGIGRGAPAAVAALRRLQEVERKLALAESRLEESDGTPGIRGGGAARLESLTTARMRALRRLSRTDPAGASLYGAPPPNPWDGVRTLGANEVVLEYAESDGRFQLFRIDRSGVEAWRNICSVDEVREIVDLLRFQLGKGVLGEEHARHFGGLIERTLSGYFERLHDLLLGPVAESLDGKDLRIVPHGLLHGLPFHALESGGSALIDRCLVSYAPSLGVLGLLSRRRGAVDSPPLVLGVPDRAAPEIEAEVDAVRRIVRGAEIFRGSAATTTAIRTSERRSLLHVACHGFFSEDGPWAGGLRLGDAWLSLPEIYTLRGTADLVVLSGCETGRGTVYSGDEWVGLVRGFLQAGARSVVASLWEVHDRSAVALMEDFYSSLASGVPVGRALAEAQRAARRKDRLAIRWAPFLLIGDPTFTLPLRKAA